MMAQLCINTSAFKIVFAVMLICMLANPTNIIVDTRDLRH